MNIVERGRNVAFRGYPSPMVHKMRTYDNKFDHRG
jgi:hypothetical protein